MLGPQKYAVLLLLPGAAAPEPAATGHSTTTFEVLDGGRGMESGVSSYSLVFIVKVVCGRGSEGRTRLS
jgi:hypothetical protein